LSHRTGAAMHFTRRVQGSFHRHLRRWQALSIGPAVRRVAKPSASRNRRRPRALLGPTSRWVAFGATGKLQKIDVGRPVAAAFAMHRWELQRGPGAAMGDPLYRFQPHHPPCVRRGRSAVAGA
jgi:hypothetical protein